MGERRFRAVTRALLPIVGTALLSGCGGAVLNGVYLLETARVTLVDQRFGWHDSDRRWSYGPSGSTNDGDSLAAHTYNIRDGYFISYNGPNFAVTNERYPGNAEVILAWQLWDSYAPGIEDNGFGHDFRIVLDTTGSTGFDPHGPVVELKLFALGANFTHELRVRDDVDAAAGTVVVNDPAIATNRGTLHVVFRLDSNPPTITARALNELGDPFLEVSHEVSGGWAGDVQFFVEAVGGYHLFPGEHVEPRVIDSVLVLSPGPSAEVVGSTDPTMVAAGGFR